MHLASVKLIFGADRAPPAMQICHVPRNPEVLPNVYHRDKIWLPNKIKAGWTCGVRLLGILLSAKVVT